MVYISWLSFLLWLNLVVSRGQDCSSYGQIHDIRPENQAGDFFSSDIYVIQQPIACDGNITRIKARGFNNDNSFIYDNVKYKIRLKIFRPHFDGIYKETNNSISLFLYPNFISKNYSYVSVKSKKIRVPVRVGDLVAFNGPIQDKCTLNNCFINPIILANATTPVLHTTTTNATTPVLHTTVIDIRNMTTRHDVVLNIRLLIDPNPTKEAHANLTNSFNDYSAGIIVCALVVIGLVCLIIPVILLFKKMHKKKIPLCTHLQTKQSTTSAGIENRYTLSSTAMSTREELSMSYDYIQDLDVNAGTGITNMAQHSISNPLASIGDNHSYEFDPNNQNPFCEPADQESELLLQLQHLGVVEISEEDIDFYEALGSGQFGVVSRGIWRVDGKKEREVAIKQLKDRSSEANLIQLLQEAAIIGQFKYPNVIFLHGICTIQGKILIVLEMIHRGTIRERLQFIQSECGGRSLDSQCSSLLLYFCRQVASGLNYLSMKGFVHRDIAARNILVTKKDVCKIADFGLSRELQNAEYYISQGGRIPVKWTAPEALHLRKYSTASDVWSFAVVMYEIWAIGHKPYKNMSNIEVISKVDAGYRLPPPPGCPRLLYELMIKCWSPLPEDRPSPAEVVLELQCPDFAVLTWTAEDVSAYSDQTRTLGAPLEAGEELYQELQQSHL